MKFSIVLAIFFIVLTTQNHGFAGILDDFESAKEPEPESTNQTSDNKHGNRRRTHRNNDDDFESLIFELFVKGLWYSAAYGGNTSEERYGYLPEQKYIEKRQIGEPLIPNVRFDFHHQKGQEDIKSSDFRLEYGKGQIGAQARTTVMTEGNNVDHLRLNQAHFLYRMSFGNHFGINAGFGISQLNGNNRKTAVSFAFPIYFHPTKLIGIEMKIGTHLFQNAKILDLDYAILFTKKYLSLVLGYRELVKSGVDITGPYAGISIHY